MHLPNKIGIIGLGLIGGSIAKALKKRRSEVQIASLERECADLDIAMQQKAVDRLFSTWEELIAWSELIVLASPLSTLATCAEEIANCCPKEKKLIVIDVGSVKKASLLSFEEHTKENIDFLSTHPMAGKEKWGFVPSDASLFENCSWILSPHGKNKKETISSISSLIEQIGGRPIVIDPQKHDEKVALISHLPALLSRRLLEFVEEKDPEALQLAGPGFESMTRLSKDNPRLQSEIAAFNREELTKQFASFLQFLETKR